MTIQLRKDTAAIWTAVNPVLFAGQMGFESDTNKLKIGDGVTAWAGLAYFGGAGGSGTVTNVSVVTANGVSGSVANPTTTPAITLTLGAITPTSIVATGAVSGSNLSGTNTGDQTSVSGNAGTATTLQTSRNFSISGGGITAAAVAFNGSAAVVLSASVDAAHITLARMANLAANSIIGNNTGVAATPMALTAAQVRTLINVADGATVNSADAFLLARTNHTGTQTSATISDFNSASRAQTEAELLAGANITITPAGAGATRTLTIAGSGGGTGTSIGLDLALNNAMTCA